jgi:hypothetical protein
MSKRRTHNDPEFIQWAEDTMDPSKEIFWYIRIFKALEIIATKLQTICDQMGIEERGDQDQ